MADIKAEPVAVQTAELTPSDFDKLFGNEGVEVVDSNITQTIDSLPQNIDPDELLAQIDSITKNSNKDGSKKSTSSQSESGRNDAPPQDDKPVDETGGSQEKVLGDEGKNVLKNTVDYLISQGLWSDFEGRDKLEIDDKTYADLAVRQAQEQAYQLFDNMVNRLGDYKVIIEHVAKGEDPSEIIDLFKEQEKVKHIDTSTEQGKLAKIEGYYRDIIGWKPERIGKFINRIVEDKEVDDALSDIEEDYDNYYNRQLEAIENQTKEQERLNQQRQQNFINSIKQELDKDNTLSTSEKRMISDGVLKLNNKLADGTMVNNFYLKFAEIQSDPVRFIQLARYVLDEKSFLDKISKQESSKANQKAFSFIKGNAAATANKNDSVANDDSKLKSADFSSIFKKK